MNTQSTKKTILHWLEFAFPVALIGVLMLSLLHSSLQNELGGILIKNIELRQNTVVDVTSEQKTVKPEVVKPASRSLRVRALQRRLSRMNSSAANTTLETESSRPTTNVVRPQPKQLRILPRRIAEPKTDTLHSAADDEFPEPGNVIFPVVRTPNWGAMYSPSEWNRTYDQMPNSAYVAVPEYDLEVLTTPMATLLRNRSQNINAITAKLFYSTRHFGQYDLDAGEYTGKHAGIDLKLAEGTPFTTIAGGRVYYTGTEDVLGNYVIIEHRIEGKTYYSMYGHMKDVYVTAGEDVNSGQTIGTVGNTGNSSGPHIHLQVNVSTPNWRSTGALSAAEAAKYTISPIEFIAKY